MSDTGFTVFNPFERVYHIRDELDAHMTLLTGANRALLFDTGYGLRDPLAAVRGITDLPLTVLCSHAHYDHLLGARWFERVLLPAEEVPACRRNTGLPLRRRVLRRAESLGVPLSVQEREAYLAFKLPKPAPLEERAFDLGGLHVRVQPMPGHTPGSVGLWVEEARLLLAGDNLNPVVWLLFRDCAPLARYAETMRGILDLPFTHALCPHADKPFARGAVEAYVEGLRPETFRGAEKVSIPPYGRIDTRRCSPAEGFTLVFDAGKAFADEPGADPGR